jgi:hypothetical protein
MKKTKMNYGGMKMKTGGMVNPNAAVKAATSTKNQIGGGNPKFSAQTSAPKKPAKSKTQPAPKRGGK